MKNDVIEVLHIKENAEPEIVKIKNGLSTFQAMVGGWIEIVDIADDASIVCNEEGKIIDGINPCRRVDIDEIGFHDIIFGPFFICNFNDDGEAISLSDENIKKYAEMFKISKED